MRDLLVLVPLGDVQVLAAVAAGVPAEQPDGRELLEVVRAVDRGVLGPQRPQDAVDDRGVVDVAALVVDLGEQADEGPLSGQRHLGEAKRLGDLGLDGADARHGYRPAFGGRPPQAGVVCAAGVVLLGMASSPRHL
ncbi:hypothetical protein [Kitasatospora sp. CMC57]|uniref:hypothetical protein n=1 Tax=Kitasatospora sp. CMC57 TaxID=3231513 RepID=UPI0038B4FFEA